MKTSIRLRPLRITLAISLISIGCGLFAASQTQYTNTDLPSLGGTKNRANSINNRGWLAGYSNLTGNQSRHAALWRAGALTDLGTLGGPNSNVTWSVKSDSGIVAGISQTSTPDPLGEAWSSAAFYPGATGTGFINLGFVWENGVMRALPTLGGNNGFATGANSRGQVVGWAENTVHDPTCVPPQQLQFRPVVYGPKGNQISELPLLAGDTSGAATGINEQGQAVGISGICDQAVGRFTAKHALLWDNGKIVDLGNLGAPWWNTPTNINQRGDVVGFAGAPNDPDGNFLKHSSGRPRAECRVSVSFSAMSTAKPMESTRSGRWSGFPVTRTEIAALLFGKMALCEISTTSNRPATPRGSNRPETSTKPARLPGGRSTRPVSDEHFSPRRTDLLGETTKCRMRSQDRHPVFL